eukprot:TRINITY_DN7767_c0_g1_i1.p1 TRINITY_DN7767_c0_g1~~TRINITY_DN7767_c0_g1_i1.p1  ORF type:complete len:406 (+),score=64.22 TRINITY_DN7767_c0_g1_i1:138-1355(+)
MPELNPQEAQDAVALLKGSTIFRYCTNEDLLTIAQHLKKRVFQKGEKLLEQGQPTHHMYVIVSGSILRLRKENDQIHQIDHHTHTTTVNSLHILRKENAFSTVEANSDVLHTYVLESDDFRKELERNPRFSRDVIFSLSKEVRKQTKVMRTPLLEQQSKKIRYFYVSVAAAIESFYRSALNSLLNAKLLGQKLPTSWFPNMAVQLPTRILYINGFKGIRSVLDEYAPPPEETRDLFRLGLVVTPGLIMTPISSILEACNADKNPEPIHRKWIRGYVPRALREVIFGVGLNQLSDYCEERVPARNTLIKSVLGSMIAGAIAGYLSHVPHNLSTMKMIDPSKTYLEHFHKFSQHWSSKLHQVPPKIRPIASGVLAVVLPRGVMIRTTQITGSFIILNGTITLLQNFF